MRQRLLWPITGTSPEELQQACIDVFVQATLIPAEEPRRMTRRERLDREDMFETLFREAAAEAEGRH